MRRDPFLPRVLASSPLLRWPFLRRGLVTMALAATVGCGGDEDAQGADEVWGAPCTGEADCPGAVCAVPHETKSLDDVTPRCIARVPREAGCIRLVEEGVMLGVGICR